MDSHDPARVDELRQQLRALGYLDAGMDRFVLEPARSARSASSIAARASFRVGVLGGLLLGPTAAAGLANRLPGLVTGPRDAIVVGLYLGAVFAVVVAAVTVAVSLVVARFAPRMTSAAARWTSRAAGTLAAASSLVYLTLWWGRANADFGWASPAWTLFALAVAVTISLLLGHGVAITTMAVMASRGAVQDTAAPRRRSSWRLVAAAALLAFCGAAAILLASAPSSVSSPAAASLTVVSPGLRVNVIAIDGFDLEIYRSLSPSGALPVLTALLDTATLRFTADARDPARGWTTIATGQPPEIHGVHGLETRRVAGVEGAVAAGERQGLRAAIDAATDLLRLTRPAIASGSELRAKPFWEVAADAGLRAAVVNWWATWPAAAAGANTPVVVSDRAPLRLERGGSLDAEISPPTLYERLRAEWPAITKEADAFASPLAAPAGDAELAAALRRSAQLDALQLRIATRLTADAPDLLTVYLPGLDVLQHTLLGPGASAAPSALSVRLEAIRGYYRFLDALLADVARPAAGGVTVLVTQPGRRSAGEGAVALSGLMSARGSSIAKSVDIAPTILHLLGVPISRELAGAPVSTAFDGSFLTRFPVRYVASYGPRTRREVRRGEPLDAEALERLRSLGYVR